jgi:hypothetical protein
MIEDIDYEKFYDLESYLFKDVTDFFQVNGYISGVQFYCVLIWKAERAKFKNARKITKKDMSKTFDEGVKLLTGAIYRAISDLERIKILFDWEFWLATASAILTVLYPQRFTVYDFRVVEHEELKRFKNIDSERSERNAERYLEFIEAVKTLKFEKATEDLRSKDRYLWGRSRYTSMIRDIESGFPEKKKET